MSPASSQPNRHLTAKHTMHIVRSSFRESDVMPHDAKLSDHGLSQHHICDILRVRSPISRLSQLLTFYLGFHLRPSLVCFRPISPLIRLTHVSATLVHAFLYFRKQIWTQARRSIHEQPDIHARLMSKYPQGRDSSIYDLSVYSYRLVPEWWYATIFVSMFVLGIVSIEVWPTYVILSSHRITK